jgi:hypothetical protein
MRRIGLLVTWELLHPLHPGRDAGKACLEAVKAQRQWNCFGAPRGPQQKIQVWAIIRDLTCRQVWLRCRRQAGALLLMVTFLIGTIHGVRATGGRILEPLPNGSWVGADDNFAAKFRDVAMAEYIVVSDYTANNVKGSAQSIRFERICLPKTNTTSKHLLWAKDTRGRWRRNAIVVKQIFNLWFRAGDLCGGIYRLSIPVIFEIGNKIPGGTFGIFNNLLFLDAMQEHKGTIKFATSFVSFFKGAPLKDANDDQAEGKNYQETLKQSIWVQLPAPLIGKALFVLGLLCGLAALILFFFNHWLTLVAYALGIIFVIVGTYLTTLDRRSEDIRVLSIVVAELELGDIERHIFAAHFVECADHATLENRPETFNGLSVNCANDILPSRMVNSRVRVILVERIVARILIGAKQADFMGDGFADERGGSIGVDVSDNAGDHIALAADGADDWRFAGTDATSSTAATAFIPMPVFGQAADESFIDFDNTAEFSNVFHQGHADLVAHGPSCLIRTEAHKALDLQRADAFLAGEHEMDNAIPIAKRLIGILEYCSGSMRKAIAGIRSALIALPTPWPIRQFMRVLSTAARAPNTFWPTAPDEICATRIFVREHPFELSDCKLMDWFGLFACHEAFPSDHGRRMA